MVHTWFAVKLKIGEGKLPFLVIAIVIVSEEVFDLACQNFDLAVHSLCLDKLLGCQPLSQNLFFGLKKLLFFFEDKHLVLVVADLPPLWAQ